MYEICLLPILEIGKNSFRRELDLLRQEIITDAFRTEYAPDVTEQIPVEILEKGDVPETEMSNDILEKDGRIDPMKVLINIFLVPSHPDNPGESSISEILHE